MGIAPRRGMARWQALESSPEVLSSLARALTSDERWRVHDVWGLDDDLLAMCVDETSCRCAALVLLFPSKAGRPVRATTDEEKKRTEGMYFLRQELVVQGQSEVLESVRVAHHFA